MLERLLGFKWDQVSSQLQSVIRLEFLTEKAIYMERIAIPQMF